MRYFKPLILLVCMAFSASALAQDYEFRLYDVAPSYREEVYGALQRLLGNTGMASGVELLPTGQIVINATPAAHQQVAVVLDEIRKHEAEPTPRVTLHYWVVLGSPELASADMPTALRDVLGEIREVHGPLSFRLLGNATLVTDSGMRGDTSGNLRVNQVAYVQGTRLQAQLSIGFFYSKVVGQNDSSQGPSLVTTMDQQGLELNTSMEQGEFVVVGENSITDLVDGQSALDGTIFYIVHWSAAD